MSVVRTWEKFTLAYSRRVFEELGIDPEKPIDDTHKSFIEKRVKEDIQRFVDAADDAGMGVTTWREATQ